MSWPLFCPGKFHNDVVDRKFALGSIGGEYVVLDRIAFEMRDNVVLDFLVVGAADGARADLGASRSDRRSDPDRPTIELALGAPWRGPAPQARFLCQFGYDSGRMASPVFQAGKGATQRKLQ